MDYIEQRKDPEATFVKEFLIEELELTLGVDFSFTDNELLLNQKAFLAMLEAVPDSETRDFIMSITVMD